MTCTFFGNKNITQNPKSLLYSILIDLIENKKVNMFYVGNQGAFDDMVINTLKNLKLHYTHIDYAIVLAYLPSKNIDCINHSSNTIYPERLEYTPRKYAISKRNIWMIEQSDYVVTYVKNTTGNSNTFKNTALKKGKIVIELYNCTV